MKVECGICEYKGGFESAPSFLCFNCGDAIRRLVWIRNREQDQSERLAMRARAEGAEISAPISVASGQR